MPRVVIEEHRIEVVYPDHIYVLIYLPSLDQWVAETRPTRDQRRTK